MAEPDPQLRGTLDGADCAGCPFSQNGKAVQPIVGIGPSNPDWIVVGEGPGQSEIRWGSPFVGATGQILNRMLTETGIDRRRLWLTNVTACLPPKGAAGSESNRELAASACRNRLKRELAMFPGKPVLAAGGVATRELLLGATNLKKITDLTGTYHEVDFDGSGPRGIIPTVHPAAMLHAEGNKEKTGGHTSDVGYWALKYDALKVNALARGQDIRLKVNELIDVEYQDAARANRLFADIVKEIFADNFCGIDLETTVEDELRNTALQGWAARITLLGLSTRKRSISIAWGLLSSVSLNLFRAIVSSRTIVKVFHNLSYDTAVLQNPHYRFKLITSWANLPPVEDTLLAHHAAFPGAPHHLQAVACQFRAVPPWKAEFRDGDETPQEAAEYNAKDVLCTAKALAPLQLMIKKTATERVYDVDRKCALLAAKMHLWGFPVDYEVNQEMKRRLSTAIELQRNKLVEMFEADRDVVLSRLAFEYGKTQRKSDPVDFKARCEIRRGEIQKEIDKGRWVFDPSKDNHMLAMFRVHQVPLLKFTKTGKTSMAADALEAVAHYPVVAAHIRHAENETQLGSFVIRMFEWVQGADKKWRAPHVQDDGRCHSIWSVNKISGRWGSEKVGCQNWPEGDETHVDPSRRLPNIRRQVVVRDGKIIVGFDLEQLEARLMALQSGDPFLCRVFSEGLDIHAEFAKILFPQFAGLEKDGPDWTRLRTTTKRFEYGGLYGGSDETVWKSIVTDEPGITKQAVSVAIAKMKAAVGGVLAWQANLLRETSKPPYELRSFILGRRRVFPLGNPPATDVNNNPNQFAGADVMDIGIINMLPKLDKYVKRGVETCVPLKNVHDAMYFECDEGDAWRVAADIKEAWTQAHVAVNGVTIHFPIEIKMGYALHAEPKDKDKERHPQLVWPVGRPGLKKVKV